MALRGGLAYPRPVHFPLDHGQDGGDQLPHVRLGEQAARVRRLVRVRQSHQAPELNGGIGQRLGGDITVSS